MGSLQIIIIAETPPGVLDRVATFQLMRQAENKEVIAENGDFKHHQHNRLYVYNTARQILA